MSRTSTATALSINETDVPTRELQRAVKDVRSVITRRPVVPVIGGVVLDSGPGGTFLAAFDYENSIRIRVDAAPQPKIRGIIDAAELDAVLKHHDKAGRTALSTDGTSWFLTQGTLTAQGGLLPEGDYPALPVSKAPWIFSVPAERLRESVKRVSVSACREATLPALAAVRFELAKETLSVMATDRFRVGFDEFRVKLNTRVRLLRDWSPFSAPTRAIVGAAKLLDGDVRICWDADVMVLRTDRVTMTIRAQAGQYPQIRRLLPDSFGTVVTVDRKSLLGRAKYIAEAIERNTPVKLVTAGGILTLAGTGDSTVSTVATCDIERIDGTAEAEIAFNPGYLVDALNTLGGTLVSLGIVKPNRPAMFTDPDDEDGYRYLLMPVRLS